MRLRCLQDLGLLADFLLASCVALWPGKSGLCKLDSHAGSHGCAAGGLQPGPLQVRVVSRPLAGSPGNSPQADVEGNSPSSQGHPSAAGSPFSPASSPEWHSTPRWPQYANFGAHSSRPAQPSTLSHVTSAAHGAPLDDTASQDSEARLCTTVLVILARNQLTMT